MAFGFLGAIVGAVLNRNSAKSAQAANDRNIAATNATNRELADLAYKRNLAAVKDSRKYEKKEQLEAEARALKYTSPTETRRQLEEAGYNPLTGSPQSAATGVASSGVNSGASAAVASSAAAAAGIAHQDIAPVFQANTALGNGIAQAGLAYDAYQQDQQEQQLRESQIQLESDRLNRIIQKSSMRPVVPGPYGSTLRANDAENPSQIGSPSTRVGSNPSTGAGIASRTYLDRVTDVEPVKDLPALGDVTLPSGVKLPALNNELELEGPAAWMNSVWIGSGVGIDVAISGTQKFFSRNYMSREAKRSSVAARYSRPQRTFTPSPARDYSVLPDIPFVN